MSYCVELIGVDKSFLPGQKVLDNVHLALPQAVTTAVVGAWNKAERAFRPLDSSYFNWVSEGLRVAKKQAAPQLIRIPLPRAEKGGQS